MVLSRSEFNLFLSLLVCLAACKTYSFTGANIPDNIKSVQIDYFPNDSDNGPASLSQSFTEDLQEKFISEANLNLVTRNGDIEFRGFIAGYQFTARAPTQGESTALNRLTISVKVEFVNNRDEKDSWTQTFSRFAEFSSDLSLTEVEAQLIEQINLQIVDDIFNKALVKW